VNVAEPSSVPAAVGPRRAPRVRGRPTRRPCRPLAWHAEGTGARVGAGLRDASRHCGAEATRGAVPAVTKPSPPGFALLFPVLFTGGALSLPRRGYAFFDKETPHVPEC
jgi:hypothetical protein